MKRVFTHTGVIEGYDVRTRPDFKRTVRLRQTKLHWVTEHMEKFRKDTGRGMGDWPLYGLDLSTVKEETS